jgi:hypothetical protein
MGSMIILRLGKLEIDVGKNSWFLGYQALFQEQDLSQANYYYIDDIVEQKEAYCRPLRDTITRLALLGYSLDHIRDRYEKHQGLDSSPWRHEPAPFDVLVRAVSGVDVHTCAEWYDDTDEKHPSMRAAAAMVAELLPGVEDEEARKATRSFFEDIQSMAPLARLRLLAENPNNLEAQVIWEFSDVVEGGYVDFDDVRCGINRGDRFLIVTEGSTDSAVIERALTVLRPDIRDFFDFIDMDSNYPLTGAGNLHNFYQGLLKINVLNNVLVIYDNDSEGSSKFTDADKLEPLTNVRIMKLPELVEFGAFVTTGPTGEQVASINGKAVSIECFLDLLWEASALPRVRWTGYHHRTGQYQGELESKELYVRRFLALKELRPDYDYSKLRILIEHILEQCVVIAGGTTDVEPF